MKTSGFKKLLKEAVREVFQEEIKEILYEALKQGKPMLKEAFDTPHKVGNVNLHSSPKGEIRDQYVNHMDVLGDMINKKTSNTNEAFIPEPGVNAATDALPDGDISMDQISSLLGTI